MILLKILLIALIVVVIFFAVTFLIYLLNLDMKAAAAMTPILKNFYKSQQKKREKR